MITKRTVLILGAGSSAHVGYPLGRNLVNALCAKRGSGTSNDFPMGWTDENVDHFLTRLSRAGHYSIDAFLETVPKQADLGKYLIARELKRNEDLNKLFPPNNSGWYQYLFNSLLEQNKPSGFKSSTLSIITFNYDRSLEAYLHESLMARFNMSPNDASSTLAQIPIVHVHGSLGHYPEIPYESDCTSEKLFEISQKIKIIHDVSEPLNGFCNPEFEKANKLLNESERIFFLGFGFHPDNIRRFQFFEPDKTAERQIYATTTEMGSVDIQALISRLQPLGFGAAILKGNSCNEFFSHVAALQ